VGDESTTFRLLQRMRSDGAPDATLWEWSLTAAGRLALRSRTDSESGGTQAIVLIRTGTNIDSSEFNTDLLDFNGNADISGTLAVGGAATFSNNVTIGGTITGNGSGLTSRNASNLSSGTVPNARLSSDVPLKNAPNVFTEQQTIQRTSTPTLTVERVGSTSNAVIETKTEGGSVYFGNTNGSTFAIGATAGLSSPW